MPRTGMCGVDLDMLAFVVLVAVFGFLGCEFVHVD